MRKICLIMISLALLLTSAVFNDLHAKSQTYWDIFKEKKQIDNKLRPELNFDLITSLPLGSMGDLVYPGLGFMLGFHGQKRIIRFGGDLGFIYNQGAENRDSENGGDDKVTRFFINIPLYFDFGLNFRIGKIFTIGFYISVGVSLDVLKYLQGGISLIGAGDYTTAVALHPSSRAVFHFGFAINRRYEIRINFGYVSTIEIDEGLHVASTLRGGVGMVRKF